MTKTIKPIQLGGAISEILGEVTEAIKADAEMALRATMIKVWGDIITDTPVGNPDLWVYNRGTKDNPDYVDYLAYNDLDGYKGGTARGNWFIGLATNDKTNISPNKNKGATYVGNSIPKEILGKKVFLYNNLPYITRLEFGWSTQAPVGMVRKNTILFPSILRRAFKQV